MKIKPFVKNKLQAGIRKSRRETIYKYLMKKYKICPCYVCKKHVEMDDMSLEHIIPVSLGGTDDLDNLSISHQRCNRERGNRIL